MTREDYPEFCNLILATAEIYDKTPSKGALRMYFSALNDLDLKDVKKGISRHVNDPKNGQFMIKPADIRRHVEGRQEDRALLAWSKLEKAIFKVGAYSTITFDDAVLMRVVIDMGGWVRLCSMTEKEAPFLQKEFERRYLAYSGGTARFDPPRKLIGIFKSHESLLFGDREKARKLLEGKADKSGEVLNKLGEMSLGRKVKTFG